MILLLLLNHALIDDPFLNSLYWPVSELIVKGKQHCTFTTDLKVLADIIKSPVRKPCCAALVIDLSKALFTVDHCDLRKASKY